MEEHGAGTIRFGDREVRLSLGDEQRYFLLGGALGHTGTVALGLEGEGRAALLARAVARGVRAWGGTALSHQLTCPTQGAWLASRFQLSRSLFLQQRAGRLYLHLFGPDGLSVRREEMEEIERFLLSPPPRPVHPGGGGRIQTTSAAYVRHCVHKAALPQPRLRQVTAAVPGTSPEEALLRRCLTQLGCRVVERWQRGIPAFGAERGGFLLTAQDERGALLEPEQLLPLVCLIEMEQGSGSIALPDSAGAAAELVAAGFGGECLRLGRDGEEARRRYAAQPWLWDAAWAAVRICSRMAITGEKLEELMVKTPRFSQRRREIPVQSGQQAVLQALALRHGRPLSGEGLRLRTGNGWVYLSPSHRRQALRIIAESRDMELAAELCDFFADQAARTDRALLRQDTPGYEKK